MYIWDALYGKIEFDSLTIKCMMSPEVQRLREVRLCNINSLCLTGGANVNRFEHSVGTAYLAIININSILQRHIADEQEKQNFVIAALLHDVANGPFGHSFEYIMEKTGFIPEKNMGQVFTDAVTVGTGTHNNNSPFETFYFGRLRELTSILSKEQIKEIDSIISGTHFLSKLLSDKIDIDNIDNVFRMAYHMGISFRKEAPVRLAEAMFIRDNRVQFMPDAKTYLQEWFMVRKKVYKFLLLNPQEFAGKYMLTEAMDISFECIAQKKTKEAEIKWNYIDFQLMEEMNKIKEVWINRKTLLLEGVDKEELECIQQLSNNDEKKKRLKTFVESLELQTPIKEVGKTGESRKLDLSEHFSFEEIDSTIKIINRNRNFYIENGCLYKEITVKYNPSQIVSRIMTGDLYYCVAIFETLEIKHYNDFLEYERRISIEDQLESRIRSIKGLSRLNIGIHPILDVNKTERQLSVRFANDDYDTTIGEAPSRKLLLGLFIKNEPYGLRQGKVLSPETEKTILEITTKYFDSFFNSGVVLVPLYEEAKYGQQ